MPTASTSSARKEEKAASYTPDIINQPEPMEDICFSDLEIKPKICDITLEKPSVSHEACQIKAKRLTKKLNDTEGRRLTLDIKK